MKRLFFVLCCVFFYSTVGYANDAEKARSFAEKVGHKALVILKDTGLSKDVKSQKLQSMFLDTVDTDWVARFVLGHHWRKLDQAKQKAYLESYRHFLVKSYTSNFEAYAENTSFEVNGAKPLKREGQFLVAVDVIRPSQTIKIDYRVREDKNDTFKIIDIVVEGVSLLATQRSEFASVVQRQGVDHLIEQLRSKK